MTLDEVLGDYEETRARRPARGAGVRGETQPDEATAVGGAMRFLVDAHMPRRMAACLNNAGCDAMHTRDLPDGNRSTDEQVIECADRELRVVVTKDADFVNGRTTHIVGEVDLRRPKTGWFAHWRASRCAARAKFWGWSKWGRSPHPSATCQLKGVG